MGARGVKEHPAAAELRGGVARVTAERVAREADTGVLWGTATLVGIIKGDPGGVRQRGLGWQIFRILTQIHSGSPRRKTAFAGGPQSGDSFAEEIDVCHWTRSKTAS